MRITHTIVTTLVLTSCFATSAIAADKTAAVEKEITKIENELAVACVKADVEALGRYNAPDWTFTAPDGQVLTWAEGAELWKKGAIKVAAMKLDEVKVKVYGNTAIASVLDTETTTIKGKDVSGQYRTTDVFLKRDGKWMIVATHSCKVVKE